MTARRSLLGMFVAVFPVICTLAAFNVGCRRPEPGLLDFLLQVKPGMTVEAVKALFPAAMLSSDASVDQATQSTLMDRKFSVAPPVRVLLYINHATYAGDAVYLYFDRTDRLVGIDHSASSGRQLQESDLRF